MGRKDKLRREKQARQRKTESASLVAAAAAAAAVSTATATATATATTTATATATVKLAEATTSTATETGTSKKKGVDAMFPKSSIFVQDELLRIEPNEENFLRGAKAYGCVHCMEMIGFIHYSRPNLNGRQIHLSLPWYLEGAILGSSSCALHLLTKIYGDAKPQPPASLVSYWMKMVDKYFERNGGSGNRIGKSNIKQFQDDVTRECVICDKADTKTLTLRQCVGCRTSCYCSEMCQKIHWARGNHKSECKQIQILNKYHKPYAKDIRAAAIRGETHPAVEKLRSKLGLSRPIEEYQQLRNEGRTHDGLQIDPYEYLIGKEDGKVWIGSTPNSLGPLSSNTTTATTTTTTT